MISSSEESLNTPYGVIQLLEIHTSTQSTTYLIGFKMNHEKTM
jgi:hypothetical protein